MSDLIIGVVGNPNCGKTTLFNALTGAKQQVGNWPGVTVERKEGYYQYQGQQIQLIDLPGIYSLDATPDATSLDERIAQDYILSGEPHLIINIIDASNLERNLYLTTQLLEMGIPFIIAINMMDIAQQRAIKIDLAQLTRQLNIPVIPLIASKKEGIDQLKQIIAEIAAKKPLPTVPIKYPEIIENAITQLQSLLATQLPENKIIYSRWLSLRLLENDPVVTTLVNSTTIEVAQKYQQTIEEELDEEVDILIADSRYSTIATVVESSVTKSDRISRTLSDKIDRIVLNRVLGIPIFLAIMYLMFTFTIQLGGAFVDFFDLFAGAIVVEGLREILTLSGAPVWLSVLLADGLGGGIQVVSTFIPIIGFLYLFLSFLEDSGYMARAAFVMDRFMRFIGLPGKSFVPLIVSFGCNVPGIMATRTLEHQRDRILTVLMNPFMSCGARLPVYTLFIAAFFPNGGQNLVFILYLLGIAIAVFTGFVLKNTLLKSEASPFIMELPPYHLPTLHSIVLRTWERLNSFVIRAGKVIVPMVIVIAFLNSWGTDGSYGNENTDKSVLSVVGRTLTPAFAPLGIQEENWPATVGIFTGILAKEVVVGTLDAIYSQMSPQTTVITKEETTSFLENIQAAVATIPANLSEVVDALFHPFVGDRTEDSENMTTAVNSGTFGAMVTRFDGQIGAFAYLLFILLYSPCAAAIAAIYRETNGQWAIFSVLWTTGLAYLIAVIFYQTATFGQHPMNSMIWISGLLAAFALILLILYYYGQQAQTARSNQ